tara:strand:+ start:156 stop:356 length:201 start_codon:yes stop_codon:yes gene_type:complete
MQMQAPKTQEPITIIKVAFSIIKNEIYCNIKRMQMQAPKTQEPITIIKVAFSIASITFFMLPALSL